MNTNSLKSRIAEATKANAKKVASNANTKTTDYSPLTGEFNAVLESAKPKVYFTGSFGYEFTFRLTDKEVAGRKIWENIILVKADGTPTSFSAEKLMRRLAAFSVTGKALETFALPESVTDNSDLDTLNGAQVILKLEREISSNGKPGTKVKAVYKSKMKG